MSIGACRCCDRKRVKVEHEHRQEPYGGPESSSTDAVCVRVCFQVVQIIIGVLCVLFSLSATYSPLLTLHAPFCLAVTVRSPPSSKFVPVTNPMKHWCLCSCPVCGLGLSGLGGTETDFSQAGKFLSGGLDGVGGRYGCTEALRGQEENTQRNLLSLSCLFVQCRRTPGPLVAKTRITQAKDFPVKTFLKKYSNIKCLKRDFFSEQ